MTSDCRFHIRASSPVKLWAQHPRRKDWKSDTVPYEVHAALSCTGTSWLDRSGCAEYQLRSCSLQLLSLLIPYQQIKGFEISMPQAKRKRIKSDLLLHGLDLQEFLHFLGKCRLLVRHSGFLHELLILSTRCSYALLYPQRSLCPSFKTQMPIMLQLSSVISTGLGALGSI